MAFLSSASILSYSIGPICLLAMRKLQPDTHRPFKLSSHVFFSHLAFYICNLMLYWCGFSILWKLDVALMIGLFIAITYHGKSLFTPNYPLYWFIFYMASLLIVSYLGSFGGIGILHFPFDLACLLPLSILTLYLSQRVLSSDTHKEITCEVEVSPA